MVDKISKFNSDLIDRYRFGLEVIFLINKLPNKRNAWMISGQLITSAISVGANLVAERASRSRRDYKQFFEIALRSANESIYQLHLLTDAYLASEQNSSPLIAEAQELGKMSAAAAIKLKKS